MTAMTHFRIRIMTSRIRIIGGQWKRRLLPVPDAPGLRPTPDRVRETLFNWLGQDLSGWRCIDLFAGSGALGFEAASRGAARVDMVEQNPAIARGLQGSIQQLGAQGVIRLHRADASRWLAQQQSPGSTPAVGADLILLDPPFRAGWLERILPAALARLAPQGFIYAEADFPLTPEWLARQQCGRLAILRSRKAGQVHYHLLQDTGDGGASVRAVDDQVADADRVEGSDQVEGPGQAEGSDRAKGSDQVADAGTGQGAVRV